MKINALVLGATLGFLFAAVPSCGGSSNGACGPNNCGGCCDATGACVPASASNSNTACGTQGNLCQNCTTSLQTCNPNTFTCQAGNTGGGTGGGATGGGSGGGTGGGATGGGTGGGATGGGTGGGATGGGTGGGATGGGTGGGATGGGTGGGGAVSCSYMTQNCATGSCMLTQAGAGVCAPGDCNLQQQNCDGGTCALGQDTGGNMISACVAPGTRTVGQSCGQGVGDCVNGHICAGSGGAFACRKLCYGNAGDCSAGEACAGPVGNQNSFVMTCVPSCDVLLQDCASNNACVSVGAENICVPPGAGGANASCPNTTGYDCQRGFGCFNVGGSPLCKQYCNPDAGSPTCPAPTDGGTNPCVGTQSPGVGACAN